MKTRSILVAALVGIGVLSSCGASAPPKKELAGDVIDGLDVPESVKVCMHAELAKLDADELDKIADLADKAERGKTTDTSGTEALAEFQAALSDCNKG